MGAARSGHTFVTYGPLLEWSVEGRPSGARLDLPRGGGTLDVEYELASVTVPMTRVERVGNGETRESVGTRAEDAVRKRMRLVLTSAHRRLHNEMHRRGAYHEHAAVHEHHGRGRRAG